MDPDRKRDRGTWEPNVGGLGERTQLRGARPVATWGSLGHSEPQRR